MNQRELAIRAGITAAHLSNIENEKVSLSRRVLEQISAVLGRSSDEFMLEDDHSKSRQGVVDRRGRSAAEAFMVEMLARAIYKDVHEGRSLSQSGWRTTLDFSTRDSEDRNRSILDGLRNLGLVEQNQDCTAFRLIPSANKKNAWISKCWNIQKYRDRCDHDEQRLIAAGRETDELLNGFLESGNSADVQLGLAVTGLALVLRECRLHIFPDEIIQAKLIFADVDKLRVRSAPQLSFRALPRSITDGINRDIFLSSLRERWHNTPACRKSKFFPASIFSDSNEVADAPRRVLEAAIDRAHLERVAGWLLTVIYGSWVVWCHLERQKLLPFTDEARADHWAKEIVARLATLIDGVPNDVPTCTEALTRTLEEFEPVGDSCELPVSGEFTAENKAVPPGYSHDTRVGLLHFPWDDV